MANFTSSRKRTVIAQGQLYMSATHFTDAAKGEPCMKSFALQLYTPGDAKQRSGTIHALNVDRAEARHLIATLTDWLAQVQE